MVKTGKYIGFRVCRRSYLLVSPVIARKGLFVPNLRMDALRYVYCTSLFWAVEIFLSMRNVMAHAE